MTLATEFPTYAELQSDIEDELDIQVSNSGFIDQAEMIHYCNRGIDLGEQLVHTLYEDYFLARDTVTLDGSTEYSPPSDIYAMKIRGMIYHSGSRVYEIKRERDWRKFIDYRMRVSFSSDEDMVWFPINETAGAWKLLFSSTPTSGSIERWYLRQANRIVFTSDVLDIPESKNYILSYMRYRVILKQKRGNPDGAEIAIAKDELEQEKRNLENTLGTMVPDNNNTIEMDPSHYEDHV